MIIFILFVFNMLLCISPKSQGSQIKEKDFLKKKSTFFNLYTLQIEQIEEYISYRKKRTIPQRIEEYLNSPSPQTVSQLTICLFISCQIGRVDFVKRIIEEHKDISIDSLLETKSYPSWTPLMMASYYKNEEVVQYLLQTNAKVFLKNEQGETALNIACQLNSSSQSLNIVKILIEHISTLPNLPYNYVSILTNSIQENNHSLTNALVSNKNLVKKCNQSNVPLILHAVINNNTQAVTALLNSGCSPKITDDPDRLPIHFAISEGFTKIVQKLLPYHTVEQITTTTAFLNACLKGHLEIVEDLLNTYPLSLELTTLQDDNLQTALHFAIIGNHLKIVELLLTNKANINKKNIHGETPLMIASQLGWTNLVKVLISKGAIIDEQNQEGDTALSLAYLNNHKATILTLLKNKASIYICNKNDVSPLILALQSGFIEGINLLNQENIDFIQNLKYEENDCLDLLIHHLHFKEAQELLNKKIFDVNQINSSGNSRLMTTCSNHNPQGTLFLLKNNCTVTTKNKRNETALMLAIQSEDNESALVLIQKGASLNEKNKSNETALMLACSTNNLKLVQQLIPHTMNINQTNKKGETALMIACINEAPLIIRELLKNNADPTKKTKKNWFPLAYATYHNDIDTVKELLQSPQTILEQKIQSNTPLILACAKGNLEIANLLIQKGASVNITEQSGMTPLMLATKGSHIDIMKLLLTNTVNPANPNTQTESDGMTALMMATLNHNIDAIKILLNKNNPILTQIDLECHQGNSALLIACHQQQTDIALQLMEKGASVLKENIDNQTPLLFAIHNYHLAPITQIINPSYTQTNYDFSLIEAIVNKNPSTLLQTNQDGDTIFTVAATHNIPQLLHKLVSLVEKHYPQELETLLNQKNDNGWPPIAVAVWQNNPSIVKTLFNLKVDFYPTIQHNLPLLLIASQDRCIESLEIITQKKDFFLHYPPQKLSKIFFNACLKNQHEVVCYFIKEQLISNFYYNQKETTPLIFACENQLYDLIETLLFLSETDINQKRPDGETPMSIAIHLKDPHLTSLLIQNGATLPSTPNPYKPQPSQLTTITEKQNPHITPSSPKKGFILLPHNKYHKENKGIILKSV